MCVVLSVHRGVAFFCKPLFSLPLFALVGPAGSVSLRGSVCELMEEGLCEHLRSPLYLNLAGVCIWRPAKVRGPPGVRVGAEGAVCTWCVRASV